MKGPSKSGLPLDTTSRYFASARHGDRAELEMLVRRIEPRLFRFALFLTGSTNEARDLCQEAYVKLLENMDSLNEPRYFVTWLFTVTRNIFLSYVRSPKNRPHGVLADTLVGIETLRPGDYALLEALSRLPPEDRLLLLLVHLEGSTYEEAAEILKVPVARVRGRLYRIRQAMQRSLATGTHEI